MTQFNGFQIYNQRQLAYFETPQKKGLPSKILDEQILARISSVVSGVILGPEFFTFSVLQGTEKWIEAVKMLSFREFLKAFKELFFISQVFLFFLPLSGLLGFLHPKLGCLLSEKLLEKLSHESSELEWKKMNHERHGIFGGYVFRVLHAFFKWISILIFEVGNLFLSAFHKKVFDEFKKAILNLCKSFQTFKEVKGFLLKDIVIETSPLKPEKEEQEKFPERSSESDEEKEIASVLINEPDLMLQYKKYINGQIKKAFQLLKLSQEFDNLKDKDSEVCDFLKENHISKEDIVKCSEHLWDEGYEVLKRAQDLHNEKPDIKMASFRAQPSISKIKLSKEVIPALFQEVQKWKQSLRISEDSLEESDSNSSDVELMSDHDE